MKVSAKADYAVRAAAELAAAELSGTLVRAEAIATRQGIPQRFLENILSDLRHAGLVQSQRGAEGGHRLNRPAAEISVADVILGRRRRPARGRARRAPQSVTYAGPAEPLQRVWIARRNLRDVVEQVSLADLASGGLPDSVDASGGRPRSLDDTLRAAVYLGAGEVRDRGAARAEARPGRGAGRDARLRDLRQRPDAVVPGPARAARCSATSRWASCWSRRGLDREPGARVFVHHHVPCGALRLLRARPRDAVRDVQGDADRARRLLRADPRAGAERGAATCSCCRTRSATRRRR